MRETDSNFQTFFKVVRGLSQKFIHCGIRKKEKLHKKKHFRHVPGVPECHDGGVTRDNVFLNVTTRHVMVFAEPGVVFGQPSPRFETFGERFFPSNNGDLSRRFITSCAQFSASTKVLGQDNSSFAHFATCGHILH